MQCHVSEKFFEHNPSHSDFDHCITLVHICKLIWVIESSKLNFMLLNYGNVCLQS